MALVADACADAITGCRHGRRARAHAFSVYTQQLATPLRATSRQ